MKSGAADGGPPRRRPRPRWALAGLLVVVVALAIFVWQGGNGGGSGGPLNAIAEAAEVTQHEPGGHIVMRATISSPTDGKTVPLTGRMVYDDTGRTRGVMTFPDPKTGGQGKLEMAAEGAHMYMRSSLFGALPEGGKWMGLDFSSGETTSSPVSGSDDATQVLKMLEAAGEVEEVGREDVRGVPTTRYRGMLGSSDDSGAQAGGAHLRVETWIDGKGRVRRMRLINPEAQRPGGPEAIDMQMDFVDFGNVPEIKMPSPSEVFDATALGEAPTPSEGG
jgi:hypothetical protein